MNALNQSGEQYLMYFVVPLWLAAGFADWLCHRRAGIAHTSGPKESLLHLLMLAEMGLPVLAALFLRVNALVLAGMLVAFILHEITALWDVGYAIKTRVVTPIEQHIHSFLEMLPLMALSMIALMHWDQFSALFGAGTEVADFSLQWKKGPLHVNYILILMVAIVLFELLPYLEELRRTLLVRARDRRTDRRDANRAGGNREKTPTALPSTGRL